MKESEMNKKYSFIADLDNVFKNLSNPLFWFDCLGNPETINRIELISKDLPSHMLLAIESAETGDKVNARNLNRLFQIQRKRIEGLLKLLNNAREKSNSFLSVEFTIRGTEIKAPIELFFTVLNLLNKVTNTIQEFNNRIQYILLNLYDLPTYSAAFHYHCLVNEKIEPNPSNSVEGKKAFFQKEISKRYGRNHDDLRKAYDRISSTKSKEPKVSTAHIQRAIEVLKQNPAHLKALKYAESQLLIATNRPNKHN